MKRVLIVSTPALLEARNLAAWIARERVPGVRIAPSKGEWGVFAPARFAERARLAFRRVVAANNPGSHRIIFKIRATDPYTTMKKRRTFGRAVQIADMLVKGIVVKAAVLDPKGKVRFVAFKKGGRVASNPDKMDALADAAVMIAARGARQYLDTHKLTADPSALTSCLKSWVKIKFPEALKDAKDAISAGMHAVAEQTFAATMKLAGIEAAKEAARAPGTNTRRKKVVRRTRRNARSYKRTRRNPPIELAWDTMKGRKRLAALMIVGFPEDYAGLLVSRDWSELSSSVKSALTKSWVAANRGRRKAVARR